MERIGRYEVRGEIARGGMGAVYRGWDPVACREVAIKVLLGLNHPVSHKRFAREAAALARVEHPNVVGLLDHGLLPDGRPYMVLELVEGGSLQRRLTLEGPLDPDDAAASARTLCQAVAACHRAGVLHRDLKPDNVLVARDGTLKLTDFGLVRDTDASQSRTQLSVAGAFLGTPGYWAPEQAQGDLEAIGERTDVYGLGATLFALLTAEPPQEGELLQVLAGVTKARPAPSSLNPRVPAWLDAVVGRALAVQPERRFPSAEELAAALEDGLEAGLEAGPRSPRRRLVLAALAFLAASVLGLLAGLVFPKASERRSRPPGQASVAAASSTSSRSPASEPAAPAPPGPEAQRAFQRGMAAARAKHWDEARAAFDQALQLAPGFAEAYNGRGAARELLGDRLGAIQDLDEAIRLKPDLAKAYRNRAAMRWKLGQWQAVIADSSQAIRLDPDFMEAYYQRGYARSQLEDWQGALQDYGEVLRLQPDSAGAYWRRGEVRQQLGDQPGALADLGQAIRLGPDLVEAYLDRAQLRLQTRDWQGALEDSSQVLSLRPQDVLAYTIRASARLNLGDWQGALEDSSAAIQLEPIAQAYYDRSVARAELGDQQGSFEDSSEAIRLRPDYAEAYAVRSAARTLLGEARGGLQDANEALRLKPDSAEAHTTRAAACLRLQDWEGALADSNAALALDPDAASAHLNRAAARLRLGNPQGALADSDAALRLRPDSANAYYNRGTAHSQLGDDAGAIADWRRALELSPDAPWAAQARQNLLAAQQKLAGGEAPGAPNASPPAEVPGG